MSSRRVIDISVMLSPDTPVWPGDTPFSCLWTWQMSEGSSVNVSAITSSPHAGTHADAPLHVTRNGAASESLRLDAFRGPARVVDVSHINVEIKIADIDMAARDGAIERLLLKTGRSIAGGNFPESWPHLSVDCARELVRRGIVLVGFDCPSADDLDSKALDVHHVLLDNGVCVIENLDLRDATEGDYELDALPMKVAGLDAAPVRAVLR
ncbi:MAG: cyclase family protein [Gemmatimonadaceae bacterium]